MLTKTQISAGGVVFRQGGQNHEIALISVGHNARWQLPKGLINTGETPEIAALREVREETGLTAEIIEPLDKVEYWYYATEQSERIRYHKFVHFYLMRFLSGDVADHDDEVNEARWFEITRAREMLTFESEKAIIDRAIEQIK